MATYAYQSILSYRSDTGEYAYSADTGTGTLSDGESDTTFEAGDTLTGGDPISLGTYIGTLTVNGTVYIVVENEVAGPPFYVLYGPQDFTALPGPTGTLSPIPPVVSESFTVCFAAGTLIATPDGETAVEALKIGDMVTTSEGRAVPVKWIGRQTVQKFFAGDRARPVRVAAGALGDGMPHSDLVLTADHALILDGLAINAGALVNGSTISFDPAPERATYYHIETEDHDVILANGAAAETYVDYVGRRVFDNYREYVSLSTGRSAPSPKCRCPGFRRQGWCRPPCATVSPADLRPDMLASRRRLARRRAEEWFAQVLRSERQRVRHCRQGCEPRAPGVGPGRDFWVLSVGVGICAPRLPAFARDALNSAFWLSSQVTSSGIEPIAALPAFRPKPDRDRQTNRNRSSEPRSFHDHDLNTDHARHRISLRITSCRSCFGLGRGS